MLTRHALRRRSSGMSYSTPSATPCRRPFRLSSAPRQSSTRPITSTPVPSISDMRRNRWAMLLIKRRHDEASGQDIIRVLMPYNEKFTGAPASQESDGRYCRVNNTMVTVAVLTRAAHTLTNIALIKSVIISVFRLSCCIVSFT